MLFFIIINKYFKLRNYICYCKNNLPEITLKTDPTKLLVLSMSRKYSYYHKPDVQKI